MTDRRKIIDFVRLAALHSIDHRRLVREIGFNNFYEWELSSQTLTPSVSLAAQHTVNFVSLRVQ